MSSPNAPDVKPGAKPGSSSLRRPERTEYGDFFAGYVSLVPENDVFVALEEQTAQLRKLAASLDPEREQYAYGPEKWSVREILGHLVDGERVFAYRTLCFSRGDATELPGFDENSYVANSRFRDTPASESVEEFALARAANLAMLRRFGAEEWARGGVANKNRVTVRALAWIMAGHVRHHLKVLRERYGVAAA